MKKMEKLSYHVDFGPYYVHLTRKQKRYLAARSVIDRILAALALVLLSPLFLAVSIAQKVSAPDEPIFFLQKRVGKGAHCFNIIKFRTMKSSAPKNGYGRFGKSADVHFQSGSVFTGHQY